ncbi:uncharacterized protein LOC134177071 [Corticium candelabrum]|uniref:uncharacterized protein LOC134177071 n=1 Tax=Corticium candelabrum TaxID=121492 RepID=UPI002E26597B|nr:uncharacterized protein LOC134177071 [Corticium candelabrum]
MLSVSRLLSGISIVVSLRFWLLLANPRGDVDFHGTKKMKLQLLIFIIRLIADNMEKGTRSCSGQLTLAQCLKCGGNLRECDNLMNDCVGISKSFLHARHLHVALWLQILDLELMQNNKTIN